ncbi:ABC transporter permease [Paenibacillus flagellatus]|uniref:Transport permease protein n=1 Tax=Paenibacillus flagellatus TaxID=2211139 RepID=A0A2V5JYX7_9BACL|nr:ABC transporter permease [Paenibacillus flagellatus]PYI51492.1 ABC transporter [Paenibacillus flagellatus]
MNATMQGQGQVRTAADRKLTQALSARVRPKRPSALSATMTFVWRTVQKTKAYGWTALVDILLFPALFLLIFTFLFGGAISGSTGDYLQFLLPGMLVYTVTSMTVYTGVAINTDITKGVFNRFRTLPFWQSAAILGSVAVDIVRYAAAVVATAGIGTLLGFRPEAGWTGAALAVLTVVLFAFSVSWIFAWLGVVVKKTESLTTTSYLALYPLMFASNVFVDSSTMPGWLRGFVDLNPLSLASTAVRGLMHGTAAAGDVAWALAGCAVLVAVFAPLTFYGYRRKAV